MTSFRITSAFKSAGRRVLARLPRPDWRIDPATEMQVGETHRVAWDVAGAPIWFESRDLRLAPAPEAPVAAVLPAAVLKSRRLVSAVPLDPLFAEGATRAVALVAQWWHGTARPVASPAAEQGAQQARPFSALMFSGGVDSTHALLHGSPRPDFAVFVHGFDVPHDDEEQMLAMRPGLEALAARAGVRLVVLRTNARRHPALRRVSWNRTHGGALAAVGHVLRGHVGTLLISASFESERHGAWGSHWELDPLWSSSSLAVRHVGADLNRLRKVEMLCDEPLALSHLRVCWEGRQAGNCGRCAKCVRTMLAIAHVGKLEQASAFPSGVDLVERLRVLPLPSGDFIDYFADLRGGSLPPALDAALADYVARARAR
jgi:hypothetical protein